MEIVNVLIQNGSAENEKEALEIIAQMKEDIRDGVDIEDVLYDYGLELDYLYDLF